MLLPKGVLPSPLQAFQHMYGEEKELGEQGQASGWSISSVRLSTDLFTITPMQHN